MTFNLGQTDRLPYLQTELSDSQGVVDITSGTPILYWQLMSRASGTYSGVGTIIGSSTTGVVQYQWTTGDTINPGVYWGYWRINFPASRSERFPNSEEKMIFTISPNF